MSASSLLTPDHAWAYLPDGRGNSYYANLTTGETSWERPASLDRPATGSGAPSPRRYSVKKVGALAVAAAIWREYMSEEHGQVYYYNETTGETAWVIPADDDDDIEEDEAVEDTEATREATREANAEEEAAKAAAKAEKIAARRLKILAEIESTESSYVSSLRTLMKVYVEPLRMVQNAPRGVIFTAAELDAIFLNVQMIAKVNEEFLEELHQEPDVAKTFAQFAKKFSGVYKRYVNDYETAEKLLIKIGKSTAKSDADKHRYLTNAKSHPDAKSLDLRSFLIQPVQRVPRYEMLLKDLIAHTEVDHPDHAPLQEALERISAVAKLTNQFKGEGDDYNHLRSVFDRFTDSDAEKLKADLLALGRRLIKEGECQKARLSHLQRRQLFLLNDELIYAASSLKGLVLKGRIKLHDGARVESLPRTEEFPHAFAIVEKGGKGYTWLADSLEDKDAWFRALDGCIRKGSGPSIAVAGGDLLSDIKAKPLQARIFVVQAGGTLTKYNKRDGKSAMRWVLVTLDKMGAADLIRWGDPKTKECKSEAKLQEATAILHGAKSSAFFRMQGTKKDRDWLCFSVVFRERTLDFAAASAEALLDWYLALAALIPHSSEPVLDERALRQRIEQMATAAGA